MPLLADRVGRSRAWAGLLAGTAAPLLLFGALPPSRLGSGATLALALLSRFCIAGASSINYVAAAEQFPTSSRSVGLAWASGCSRVAPCSRRRSRRP